MKSIENIDVEGKKVIVRVDFNVPMTDGKIDDDNRILQSLSTINYLIDNKAKIILLSHLGKVKSEEDKETLSLAPVAERLGTLIKVPVIFFPLTRGLELEKTINNMENTDVLLIENTRFEDFPDKLESGCDFDLSEYWASLGDVFVLDAFGSAHREHSSTYGISKFLPSYAGFLIEREISILDNALKSPKNLILGGSKVHDKIGVIDNLIGTSNQILLGGALCFTFIKALGYEVGQSIVDETKLDYAKKVIEANPNKIIVPRDIVTQNGIKKTTKLSKEDIGYDIGPETIKAYKDILLKSPLIIWNGPMGWFENPAYENGTKELMKYISNKNINTIIAGGDVGSAANKYGYKFYHISTGGGATLEYLEGKTFKTLESLEGK